MYDCMWCGKDVADDGDVCNLACYSFAVQAINMVTYLEDGDTIKDIHLQPWAEALLNTQEG